MVHTITLNPAIDKLLFLKEFTKNITNRLDSVNDSIGGKGTHVSINLDLLGMDNSAYGIVFGETGSKIVKMLSQYKNINVQFIHKDEMDSRTNYLLIEDNGDCCILATQGVHLEKEIIDELIRMLEKSIKPGDSLILSGDTSNCFAPGVYNYMLEKLPVQGVKLYLDASGPTLKECLEAKPFLIKPNLDELSQLSGCELETEEQILAAINEVSDKGIENIAVSLGGDGSIVKSGENIYKVTPPKVNVRNTIGCGDCFLSGLIYGIENGYETEKTLRLATAISAATAESQYSVGFDRERAKTLMDEVEIQKLK